MKRFILLFFLIIYPVFGLAKTVTIGLIADGPVMREVLPLALIKQEIIRLNTPDFSIQFPEHKVLQGKWDYQQIVSSIQQLNDDKEVDLILLQGLIASQAAANFPNPKKPMLSMLVADRVLQGFPFKNGKSNKKNFTYVSTSTSIEQELKAFHQLIPFKQLVLPIDPVIMRAMPKLKSMIDRIQQNMKFTVNFVTVSSSMTEVIDQWPAATDALYLPPHPRFSNQDIRDFADQLNQRNIATFSLLGRSDLELGFLATLNGRTIDELRFARRIALMTQSILLGQNASQLNVELEQTPKLALNMQTARTIGFSPSWRVLETAELLFNDSPQDQITHLTDAMHRAVAVNLELQADQYNIILAEDQVDQSRAPLLPQINIALSGSHIDQDHAGVQQAQHKADAEINLSQLIYAEKNWSAFDVSKLTKQSEDQVFKSRVLDVLRQVSVAYLQLLSAQATQQVRKANLEVSESNLELAKQRVKIGYSNRSEELRWQSVIANDRSTFYVSRAATEQAETELKRILHWPLANALYVSDKQLNEIFSSITDQRYLGLLDNAIKLEKYVQFEISRAKQNAPEIKQIELISQSAQRQLDAGNRAFYVPDVSLNAKFSHNLEQGGVGANNSFHQEDSWNVGVQAQLPLFSGGARSAEVSRARHALIQSRLSHADIEEKIAARVRTAIQKVKGSFPAIRLSRQAAEAARENYELVSDAYRSGTISITSLIDAQNALLASDLSAVNALYSFLIDWIEIQRSVANFDLILHEHGFDQWYQMINESIQ